VFDGKGARENHLSLKTSERKLRRAIGVIHSILSWLECCHALLFLVHDSSVRFIVGSISKRVYSFIW
jgi:hypothetical protein